MEITLKSRNDKQIEAADYWTDNITEQILYGGAKGGAKSYTGCALIFGDALIYPGTHYFIARKELNDLRKYTMPSIQEVFKNWGLDIAKYAPFNGQDNIFNLYNGSKVFLIACKVEPADPFFERFGSMQMTRGWLEEAGEIGEDAKSNLWLSVGRWKNEEFKLRKKMFITANPKKGWLKRDFIDPWKRNELDQDKRFIQAFATDNPYLPQDYIKSLEGEKDPIRRQRLWLGDWDYDEDKDSFVDSAALSDAFTNAIVKEAKRFLTVDVARFGEDHTTYTFWEGLELYRIERFNGNDTEETKRKIREYAAMQRIPYSNIAVDEAGVGGGVVDSLKGIRGFVSASSALPTASQIRDKRSKVETPFTPRTNFANLKAQAAYKLAELINERKIAFALPNYRDMITEDLSALLRYKSVDSDGKITLKSKDEVKRDLNRSPDVGDAIIMRAWFELRQDAVEDDPTRRFAREEQRLMFSNTKRNQAANSTK